MPLTQMVHHLLTTIITIETEEDIYLEMENKLGQRQGALVRVQTVIIAIFLQRP